MDLKNSDFLNLIRQFQAHKVKYIIVGGFATNYHGYQRTTGDLDLWVKDDDENRKYIIEALHAMGYGSLDSLMTAKLIPGYCEILLDSGLYADVMGYINGFGQLDFDTCYEKAHKVNIWGIAVRFLHYNQHIYSKMQSQRLKDQLDVAELKKIHEEE